MDYLRQLGNDEKRQRTVVVATIEGKDLNSPLQTPSLGVSTIPGSTVMGKAYAIVTEAFAAGSTLDWGFIGATEDILLGLDLTVVGATRSQKPAGGIFIQDTVTHITPNASAVGSNVGVVKLCIELDEVEVKTGKYSA